MPRKKPLSFSLYLWLFGVFAVPLGMAIWAIHGLASPDSPPLLRLLFVIMLLVMAGTGFGGFYMEHVRKAAIRRECEDSGLRNPEIQTRKTHYCVTFEGPNGIETRKCRATSKSVTWIK